MEKPPRKLAGPIGVARIRGDPRTPAGLRSPLRPERVRDAGLDFARNGPYRVGAGPVRIGAVVPERRNAGPRRNLNVYTILQPRPGGPMPESLEERVAYLEGRVSDQKQAQTELREMVQQLGERVEHLDQKVDRFREELAARITNLEESVN